MNFDVIEKSGLTQHEFADLVGISRMGLHKIIASGNFIRVYNALTMLQKLVDDHKLPRGYSRSDTEKRAALVEKLRGVLSTISKTDQ